MTDCQLNETVFVNASVNNTIFENCPLQYADFSYAQMKSANFRKTDLLGANLHAIDDDKANFGGAKMKHVQRTNKDRLEAENWEPPLLEEKQGD